MKDILATYGYVSFTESDFFTEFNHLIWINTIIKQCIETFLGDKNTNLLKNDEIANENVNNNDNNKY